MFWKRICLFGCILFTAILLYRTYIVFKPDKSIFEPCSPSNHNHSLIFDAQRLKTFQTLLRFRTISIDENNQNLIEIKKCRQFIKRFYGDLLVKYPTFVEVHDIVDYSLLYKIKGSDSSLKPFLFSAHIDVVPAGDESQWEHPPFDGDADDEFIYGRGTLDDKANVFGMMEAVKEYLAIVGQPVRTFYIALTHDEEVTMLGSAGIARYLHKEPFGKDGQFDFVLDEGMVIMEQPFPTIRHPAALIGVAEKGYMTVEYHVNVAPGHSSMPTAPTAIGILAQAVNKLERTPQPSQFGRGPELSLLHGLTPYLTFPLRLVLSNLWLSGPIVRRVLSSKPSTDALQRSTTAVTLISGGIKENILPSSAQATVNHRLHTADSCQKVLQRNRRTINDDRVVQHLKSCTEPSPISPYGRNVRAYHILEQTIRQTFEEHRQPIIVAPGLMLGATDSKSYTKLSKNLYRFSPVVLQNEDLARFHGYNERIRHSDMQRTLNFYFHLIGNNQLEKLPDIDPKSEL